MAAHDVPREMKMNRIVSFKHYGGPEVLDVETHNKPTLVPAGDVLVKMSAYSLNRANVLFREGQYLEPAQFPARIGVEAVGIIEQLGAGVSTVHVGDRVSLAAPQNQSQQGYFADYNIVPATHLLPVPSSLSDLEAATCWLPFLTLYKTFVESAVVSEGNWVVLPAASSSVSLAANQLAQHLGAKTIGLTRTRDKLQQLKNLGYDEVIVSQEENIEARIGDITGDGADFAFDPVGGENLAQIVNSLKKAAPLCVYGLLSGSSTELPIFPLMASQVSISCYDVYELFREPVRVEQAIAYFLPLFEERILVPIYDKNTLELGEIVKAFDYLESNAQIGKVVVFNRSL